MCVGVICIQYPVCINNFNITNNMNETMRKILQPKPKQNRNAHYLLASGRLYNTESMSMPGGLLVIHDQV